MTPFVPPPIIGHRCARGFAPENTLAGLRHAAGLGARAVEVDIRLTADGVPVLLHDATLERTTDGQGALAATTLAALERLDAGSWFGAAFSGEPVPTLATFLGAALELGLLVNLELKGEPGDPVALANTALTVARGIWAPAGTAPPPLVSSFDTRCLEAAARIAPDWPRGLLLDRIEDGWAERADRLGAAAIIVNHARLSGPGDVAALGADGRAVLVYTVNDPARARSLREWGVASVITDRPDRDMAEAAGSRDFFSGIASESRLGGKSFIYGTRVTPCGRSGYDERSGAEGRAWPSPA